MPQRFLLDRRGLALYLGLLVSACGGAPGAVVPADAAALSADQVATWVGPTRPDAHRLYRYRWLYRDDRSSVGGRGTARVAPPDSARLDVTVALGVASGAGVVVSDTMVWGQPEDLLAFASFPLVRVARLSVMPVSDDEWARIEKMSR